MTAYAARPTVLVTSRSFSTGSIDHISSLASAGLQVVHGQAKHDLDALRDSLALAVAWIAGTGPVTGGHLAAAPRLRVLARYGVGVDAVDLAAASARGVVVTNTPGANTEAVADHSIALLLAVIRHVTAGDRNVRAGDWTARRGRELGALKLGIVGFGRIGHAVARRLEGFGTTVLAHDPYVTDYDMRSLTVQPASLEDLAEQCDAVSLHAPGGHCVVDMRWLERVRPGLVLVNSARADLVDETAIAAVLRSGHLGGYAADTLSTQNSDMLSPLLADDLANRVVITPHIAAQTVEAIDRMGAAATADVLAVLSGVPPLHPVPATRRSEEQ